MFILKVIHWYVYLNTILHDTYTSFLGNLYRLCLMINRAETSYLENLHTCCVRLSFNKHTKYSYIWTLLSLKPSGIQMPKVEDHFLRSLFITGYNLRKTAATLFPSGINFMETKIIPLEAGTECLYVISIF